MSNLLNPAQYNSIRIALRMLEQRLRQAEVWLQDAEEHGLLYQRTLQLSPERRSEVQAQIAQALALLTQLAHTLALECEVEDVAKQIRAEMSASWADVCDIRAEKLRRYGAVDPALPSVIDAPIEQLAALTLHIAALMEDAGSI